MAELKPEQRAREQIDTQLTACGWVVQNYKQYNPSAGRGIALREVPMKSGSCDYLLMVDRQAVGVVESKKEGGQPYNSKLERADGCGLEADGVRMVGVKK